MVDGRYHERLWRLVADRAGRHDRVSGWITIVCDVAVAEIAVDAAAVSVRDVGHVQDLVAATDDWAAQLEELEYNLGEGPSSDAFTHGEPVLISDLSAYDTRWPAYLDAATEHGAGAVFVFPLQTGAIRLGTFTLYRHTARGLDPQQLSNAVVLADLALTALLTDSQQWTVDPASLVADSPQGHYDDVNVATGMLAAQLSVSLDEAFLRLRAHAFSQNRSVLDVARDILHRTLSLDAFLE